MVTSYHLTEEKMMGVLIQLYDITELKKLEAIRRNFVDNASHELKTPLTAIVGYAEHCLKVQPKLPSFEKIHQKN